MYLIHVLRWCSQKCTSDLWSVFATPPDTLRLSLISPTNIAISLRGEGRMKNLGKCQTTPRRCNQVTQECGELYSTNERISSIKKLTLTRDLDTKQPNRYMQILILPINYKQMFETFLSQWGNVTKDWILDDVNIKELLISRLVILSVS